MIPPKKYNVIIQTYDEEIEVADGDLDQIFDLMKDNKFIKINGMILAASQIKKIYKKQRSYTDRELAEWQSKTLLSKN